MSFIKLKTCLLFIWKTYCFTSRFIRIFIICQIVFIFFLVNVILNTLKLNIPVKHYFAYSMGIFTSSESF